MAETAPRDVIVIGASVGGVSAILELVQTLPEAFPATIFVAVHLAPGFGSRLPDLINARCKLRASHPVDGEPFTHGRIYVAPPDNHITVRDGYMNVARGAKENGYRPSIDLLFRSAASTYGARVIGIVLSGNLDCGTGGLISIKARGGVAIVQDPREAQAGSMPRSALRHVDVDHVVMLGDIGPLLSKLVAEPVEIKAANLPTPILELEGERPGPTAPLVCPLCQGVMREAQVGDYQSFRCHVGHAFSLEGVVKEQAESVERALWAAARVLEESAALSARLAERAKGELRARFEERELEQRQQVEVLKRLIVSRTRLSDERPAPDDESVSGEPEA